MKTTPVLLTVLAGCTMPIPHAQPEVEWILVQRAGKPAVFAPATGEDPVIRSRLLTESAAVGSPAEMEIWCEGATEPTTVRLLPSRTGVRVLGPDELTVGPGRRVRVRFTSDSPGRGTIVAVPKR